MLNIVDIEESGLGDILVLPSVWEEMPDTDKTEHNLASLVKLFSSAGYAYVGLADFHAEPRMANNRITISFRELSDEAARLQTLKQTLAGDAKIQVSQGLVLNTSFVNPFRYRLPFELLDSTLDYIVLANLHSKETARLVAREVLKHKEKLALLRKQLGDSLIAVPSTKEKKLRANDVLRAYSVALAKPCYSLSDAVQLSKLIPKVKIGIYMPNIAESLDGFETDEELKSKLEEACNAIGLQFENLNRELVQGIAPEELKELLYSRDVFFVLPYSCVDDSVITSFAAGILKYEKAFSEAKIPLIPGSMFPLLSTTQPNLDILKPRVKGFKAEGYFVAGFD